MCLGQAKFMLTLLLFAIACLCWGVQANQVSRSTKRIIVPGTTSSTATITSYTATVPDITTITIIFTEQTVTTEYFATRTVIRTSTITSSVIIAPTLITKLRNSVTQELLDDEGPRIDFVATPSDPLQLVLEAQNTQP